MCESETFVGREILFKFIYLLSTPNLYLFVFKFRLCPTILSLHPKWKRKRSKFQHKKLRAIPSLQTPTAPNFYPFPPPPLPPTVKTPKISVVTTPFLIFPQPHNNSLFHPVILTRWIPRNYWSVESNCVGPLSVLYV